MKPYSWHDICRQDSSDDEYFLAGDVEAALKAGGCEICGGRLMYMTQPPKCAACVLAAKQNETIAKLQAVVDALPQCDLCVRPATHLHHETGAVFCDTCSGPPDAKECLTPTRCGRCGR